MKKDIVIVTSAYGIDRVRLLGGQAALLPVIQAGGADGVEIRHELLSSTDQLEHLASQIGAHGLFAIYSVPQPLLTENGQPDLPRLRAHLNDARRLQARLLKLPLGTWRDDSDLSAIPAVLRDFPVRLVIENDQTPAGGRIASLAAFFERVAAGNLPIAMTFDMANWHWLGEDALTAAAALAGHVAYVHVKASRADAVGGRAAVSLDNSDGRWRELLSRLPVEAPRGIEFPLEGGDLAEATRYYVTKLKEA
ncbi:sugar phosphate isomerase/epimerase family protein [Brenneria tiliae]|uniref:sugar phosphate isomerase/epimerase family protein n=1 Tax=Brenneria tiliae TaxID=2914984 RepID=UPI002014DACC|nr:sugar phosphate isomerase/epimerase [Brenneria tiliae]MCL2899879.1 sugar phosphate isomerase/epimerase [Brenneria tiliae]MCL2904632.1 sugar phosphate isomerase/epimerase [Brenneria tiliae]